MRNRHEAVVTSISWIPSEALHAAALPQPFSSGHSDEPPPQQLSGYEEVMALRDAGQFRSANVLRAWIEVDEQGSIVALDYGGGGILGSTRARLGARSILFKSVPFKDIKTAPEINGGTARFVQTAGGRSGTPLPRRVSTPPYVRLQAPITWTTIALEIDTDGASRFEVLGASSFPRHWIYGPDWKLAAKTGLVDVEAWMADGGMPTNPWGDERSPARTTAAETALERELSLTIMRGGAKPRLSTLEVGDLLTEQHAPGKDLYVLLDGVLRVEVDGEAITEIGPGAVVGERAVLEGGLRTSTLRAVTRCRVAAADADEVDRDSLVRLAQGHGAKPQPAP